MLKITKTVRFPNGTAYYSVHTDSNGVTLSNKSDLTYLPLYTLTRDHKSIYVLYDTDGNAVYPVYKYINHVKLNFSETYRNKIIYSLRYLYVCMSLYSITLENIDSDFLSTIGAFMQGRFTDNSELLTDLTVKARIGEIVEYLKWAGRDDIKSYSRTPSAPSQGGRRTQSTNILQRYEYISTNQFNNLISVMKNNPRELYTKEFLDNINKSNASLDKLGAILGKNTQKPISKYDDTAILIVSLMFVFGLRIGEVLGLTREDITRTITEDGEYKYLIYLRNRLSDFPLDQSCKNLYHPTRFEDYQKNYYKGAGGTSTVSISNSMYEKLLSYYSSYTKVMISTYPGSNLKADSVTGENENYYIFSNPHGDRLSGHNWNKILREYFKQADIPLDVDRKEKNLNHRFRHSYAMMLVQIMKENNAANPDNPPLGLADLARALRHVSTQTCYRYFAWTEEQEKQVKEDFNRQFLEECPNVTDVFFNNVD